MMWVPWAFVAIVIILVLFIVPANFLPNIDDDDKTVD
jgi:hypothetical protein